MKYWLIHRDPYIFNGFIIIPILYNWVVLSSHIYISTSQLVNLSTPTRGIPELIAATYV